MARAVLPIKWNYMNFYFYPSFMARAILPKKWNYTNLFFYSVSRSVFDPIRNKWYSLHIALFGSSCMRNAQHKTGQETG